MAVYIPLAVFLYCYGSLIKGLYFDNTICASPADRQEDRSCEKKKLVITFMLATAGFLVGYGPIITVYTLGSLSRKLLFCPFAHNRVHFPL